jgi:PKD repeat protein
LTVVFTNTSIGDYETSLWALGDGMTSTLESPIHEYGLPGVYTITLTVRGPGGIDTEIKDRYVTVHHGVYLPLLMRGS